MKDQTPYYLKVLRKDFTQSAGGHIEYVRDGNNIVLERYRGGPVAVAPISYFFGVGMNEILAVDRPDPSPAAGVRPPIRTTWMFGDTQGTVRSFGSFDAADNTWDIVHANFGEFGEASAQLLGDVTNSLIASTPRFWTGHQRDASTGLIDMNGHWYDSSLGRFLSENRMSGDRNLYRYARNNPGKSRSSPVDVDSGEELGWIASKVFGSSQWLGSTTGFNPLLDTSAGFQDTGVAVFSITVGWFIAPFVTAGGGIYATAVKTLGWTAGVGAALGAADGLISNRMLNPDAGIGSYAFAAGAGAFGGSLNPVGAGGGLAGGGLGYLIGGRRGYLTGSLAGGMLTGNLSHAWTVSARQAAARFGIEASVSIAGAGIQYSRGGSFDDILFGAHIGNMVGGGIAGAALRRGAAGNLSPGFGSSTTTVLRGMSRAEYDSLVGNPILVSHAMDAGVAVPNTVMRRLWHTFTSVNPPSPNVSTTKLPFIARHFTRRSSGVIAQFDVPTSSLQKSVNVFENEYLVMGGTRVGNVQLLSPAYRAGWRAYVGWGVESAGLGIGFGGAVAGGVYYAFSGNNK